MAGLAPANLRQPTPDLAPASNDDVIVEVVEDGGDQNVADPSGNILQINHPDGSITVSLDGNPVQRASRPDSDGWYDNLAEVLDSQELSRIAEDLMRGIDDDIQSRKEWVETRATGMKMLGLKVEVPNVSGASDGAPVEGMSTFRHPLMLEAVLRFQANARSELLPTDGPVKIRNDDNDATQAEDNLADDLERDFNHYLTTVATEFYPDTDRMLFSLGFGGTEFKKVYFCPIRNRPVSEWVNADDLIVSNDVTDLANAKRITHRIDMAPSVVKRLQILGVYRDIDLSDPVEQQQDATQREADSQQGISRNTMNPEDRNRDVYECYCELDIKGYEHKLKGRETGLAVPYRVTIDVSSREILSVVRDYKEETKDLPIRRQTFVTYVYVPGFGFYAIGLLHILGNTTNAVTAAYREMLDTGMYANFPGFLVSKQGSRQNTSIFRIPPGGGQQIDTQGQPIGNAVMPLPYQSQHMAPLQALGQDIVQTAQRLGGTSEVQVGEGKQDAPVGTTLALLEQATKVENSVHKRLHAAQAEEFALLKECFLEHPESFWQRKDRMARSWDERTFLNALQNYDLVPQADPNTASHTQRIIKYMGLRQMAAASPERYDPDAVDAAGLRLLGFGNPQEFFAKTPAPPSPEIQKGIADIQIKDKVASAQAGLAAAKTKEIMANLGKGQQEDTPVDVMDAHTRALDARTKARDVNLKAHEIGVEDQNRDQDRASHEKIAALDLAKEIVQHPGNGAQVEGEAREIERATGRGEQ